MGLGTAWKAFWQILGSRDLAEKWLEVTKEQDEAVRKALPEPAPQPTQDAHDDATYTLALLQREGRLVDFLLEDIDAYQDAQIGAAVRQIHAGCRSVLKEHFCVEPIRSEADGERIEIPPSFDPRHIRIIGKPAGDPPFQGALRHHGWRAAAVSLPERHTKLDPTVICPAEVEV
ncbi:MAG: DUF2760 domain-containing protein [Lentisphaerae bacterium]|jgi:hypothetical protein|nr:DUF2760 domain-containing protein [Lentisphaerota bacterium]MBT4815436.1 DUF2760 domain-containing protein [Lentisphaerota bacterium]MBT5611312.1 DUF2760 domain-containing protein [Lentisphaerota bacterium]MBT7058162.1 DUF2760 domain-containing protein [Lentisphaerota bacterium]MBT7848122.1 DUF2760 domain-containing protein [Lentisphaerota bacterium]